MQNREQGYTVKVAQTTLVAAMVPLMTAPMTVGVIMLNRADRDWGAWPIAVILLWLIIGGVMFGLAMRSRHLSADSRGIRYGKREYAWADMTKLGILAKRRQLHLHMRGRWGYHIFDIRDEREFAGAAEELARRASERGVSVERV